MSTRPYELFVRFAADGTVAGVSVRTITTLNGRDYESDPSPLTGTSDPAFVEFADQFSAAVTAERDALQTQLQEATTARDALQTQLQEATTARDALQTQLQEATTARDALQTQANLVPDLQSQVATLKAENAALQAEVDRLTALVPPPMGLREVTAEEFLSRFSDTDRVAIGLSQDPRAILAQQELFTRSSRIDLDSPRLIGLIDALIDAGIPIDESDYARIFA